MFMVGLAVAIPALIFYLFFVSRVASAVDAQLETNGTAPALELRGTAAVANACLAGKVDNPRIMNMAEELGVRIFICEMSMDLMGFKREEMIHYEGLEYCGVAKFLEEAMDSKIQLFI